MNLPPLLAFKISQRVLQPLAILEGDFAGAAEFSDPESLDHWVLEEIAHVGQSRLLSIGQPHLLNEAGIDLLETVLGLEVRLLKDQEHKDRFVLAVKVVRYFVNLGEKLADRLPH